MRVVECKNKHHYDADKYSHCPHCEKMDEANVEKSNSDDNESFKETELPETNTVNSSAMSDLVNTVSIYDKEDNDIPVLRPDDYSKTLSIYDQNEKFESKELEDPKIDIIETLWNKDNANSTDNFVPEMPRDRRPQSVIHTPPNDDSKTMIITGTDTNPVVGFLVAVEGPHFGESYSIYEGKNSIGRSIDARIQLNKDNNVSRTSQAYVVFDSMNNKFMVMPGEANGLAYLNSEAILTPIELSGSDQIKVGKTSLIFIPFLNNEFTWDDYIKGDK